MSLDRREVSYQVSHQDTNLDWVSPSGEEDSLEEFSDSLMELLEEDGKDKNQPFWILNLGCGPGRVTEKFLGVGQQFFEDLEHFNLTAVDLAPTPARTYLRRNDLYSEAEVIGGDAYEVLEESGEFDLVSFINILQEFPDPEPVIESAAESTEYVCFTSIKNLIHVFEDMQEESSEQYVHQAEGSEVIDIDSISLPSGMQTTFRQFPRSLEEYISKFEDLGFQVMDRTSVAANTDPLPDIARSIDSYSGNPSRFENRDLEYGFCVMERGVR